MTDDAADYAHRAAERELERLKRFGVRLAALQPRAGPVADLEAAQDANLAAFEAMTEDVGVAALDRMTVLTAELRATIEEGDDPGAATRIGPRMQAVAEELEALRDRETDVLISRIAATLDPASTSAASSEAQTDERTNDEN